MRQARLERWESCGPVAAPFAAAGALGKAAGAALAGLIVLIGGALASSDTTQAQTLAALPSTTQPIEKSGRARPVAAWVKFCERFQSECEVDASEPAMVALTSELWRAIIAVNRRVNSRIQPMTDKAHFGVVDSWDFPDDGFGDCEDYQLLKRRQLAERGLPRRAMRMTVVIDEQGEGHAVLMIRTDRGDFILDNKTMSVLSWDQTGYTYVKREGQDNQSWVSLGGLSSPTTTANR